MSNTSLLFFGFFDPKSPRTWTLRREFGNKGHEIVECRTERKGYIRKCLDLRRQYKKIMNNAGTRRGVSVLVLFPGHHIMPLAWMLTRFPRKRLIFDVFISAYDTFVCDRKMVSKWNPKAWVYWLIDFVSCHMADEVLIDTKTHRDYFIDMFKLHPKKIRVVYLESRTDIFSPENQPATSNDVKSRGDHRALREQRTTFNIFFYGSFIPLQGIDVILKAAKILENKPNIHFTILGGGQTEPEMKKLAKELNLSNVTFKPFAPIEELPAHINSADLCLGIFGTSQKARRVIPHKVLDYLACGKKIVTARTDGILEKFANDPRVILCEAGNPEDLAKKIVKCRETDFITTSPPHTSNNYSH